MKSRELPTYSIPVSTGKCNRASHRYHSHSNISHIQEVISLEVRINKEVRDYQESIFFGLSLRQCLFSLFAVAVAVGLYFVLHRFVEGSSYDWLCVLAAFPFALGGFFQYNGMTAGRFLLAVVRTLCYPKRLVFRSQNLYVKLLEHSPGKEAFTLD